MYNVYHTMTKEPFLNKTTPELFFESKIHTGAWDFLTASLRSEEPVVLLTGEYGTGKTLLCLKLVETLKQQATPHVYISTPMQSYSEALRGICKALGIETDTDDEDSLHRIVYSFFESNPDHRMLLLLDDAQEHNAKALNKVRMLVNYNVDGRNPIRLFLFGSPAFIKRLQAPDMEPLDQRIKRRYSMTGLNFIETKEYIYYRLLEAGAAGSPFFPDEAIRCIVDITNGIPRRINNICDMCLQISTSAGQDTISNSIVDEAIEYLGWQVDQRPQTIVDAEQEVQKPVGTMLTEPPTSAATAPANDLLNQSTPSTPPQRPTGHFITASEDDWKAEQKYTNYDTQTLHEEEAEPKGGIPSWAWRTSVFLLIIACVAVVFIRDIDASALVQQLLDQQ